MARFVPVFEQDGNQFFILTEEFLGQSEDEARKIAYGAMLVECIIMRMTFTKKVIEVPQKGIPHRKTDLLGVPVAIIAGPMFKEAHG